jgi:hypothetical protein
MIPKWHLGGPHVLCCCMKFNLCFKCSVGLVNKEERVLFGPPYI